LLSGLNAAEAARVNLPGVLAMAAIGCMIPIVLLVAGAAAGGIAGGTTAGLWGGAIGFGVGVILLLILLWLFDRARNTMPP
jgi:hypothetical protein